MAETMRGPLYEREPDARAIIVDQAIQSFEKTEEFKVTGSARLYLIEETLISSVEFTMAAQAGRINPTEISDTISKALILAKQLCTKRGLDIVDRSTASDAIHHIVKKEMDCPWPWIIC